MALPPAPPVQLSLSPSTPEPDPLRGRLDAFNGFFREAYAAARNRAFEGQGPVILVAGDALTLFRDQKPIASAEIRPLLYHRLKVVAHVPLAIRLVALGMTGGPLSGERLDRLRDMRGRLDRLRADLVAAPAEGSAAQDRVVGGGLGFLDQVLASGRLAREQLDAYCRAMEEPLDALAGAAAKLELEALSRVVPAWRETHLARDWDRVRVVIEGSHMAREGEVSAQFFLRLLDQGGEGGRVVYAEEKWDAREAFGLLAGHEVDHDLGQAFFGETGRMHRDLLADAAKNWLERHPPRP